MRILHLTLHREYFDKIASGEKTKEYRDIKPYWTKRLEDRVYDEIHFKNGYSKDAPFMRVEWKGMTREAGRYVIHLGAVLELKNWSNRHG
ncbi:MAG: hypothetical protein JW712_08190 [Dehalococcoidales bacterium]|nr:hypothetical protein [Dehalococcoidales bacterium]